MRNKLFLSKSYEKIAVWWFISLFFKTSLKIVPNPINLSFFPLHTERPISCWINAKIRNKYSRIKYFLQNDLFFWIFLYIPENRKLEPLLILYNVGQKVIYKVYFLFVVHFVGNKRGILIKKNICLLTKF